MSITLNAVAVTIGQAWSAFKTNANTKVLSIQYDDDGSVYTIWSLDGTAAYICTIWHGTVPDSIVASGYSQAQNDTDKSDFETNYKSYCNMPLSDDDVDPRYHHRFGNLTSSSTSEVLMAGQPYAEQASEAQRSVVSTSVQDKSSGTGAVAVRITYLDSNYVVHTEDVTLNGTSSVNTVGTNIRFIEKFQVIQGSAAVGKISLMSSTGGGGSAVCAIGAATEDAFMCHHYVPAGMRCYIIGWGATIGSAAAFKLKGQQRFGVNVIEQNLDLEALTTSPNLPEFYREFKSPLCIQEKCYIRVTAVPGSASSQTQRSQLDFWEDKA